MRRAFSRLFDNGTHVSSSSICVTLSYIPYLPFTNEQPYAAPYPTYRSCTFGGGARQWRCILGRTVQGRSKRFPLVFRTALQVAPQEWQLGVCFHGDCINMLCPLKSSLTVTPRYLASFTSSSTWLDNSYWVEMGVCFLDIRIMLHLAALNLIPHFEPQFSSKFRSFCRAIWSCLFLISLYTRRSSAKSLTLEEITDGRSLM